MRIVLPTGSPLCKCAVNRITKLHLQNRTKKGHIETYTINPKCVSMGELYGETDPNTFEWTDGLIATATRRFAREIPAPSPGEDSSIVSRVSDSNEAVVQGIDFSF